MKKINTTKRIEAAIRSAIEAAPGIAFIETHDPGVTDRIVEVSVIKLRGLKNRSNRSADSMLYEDKQVTAEGQKYRFTFRGETGSFSSLNNTRSTTLSFDTWHDKDNRTDVGDRIRFSLECQFKHDQLTITAYDRYVVTGLGTLPESQVESLHGKALQEIFDTPLTRRPEIGRRRIAGTSQTKSQIISALTMTLEPQ